jgi:hypothetical protein
MSHDGAADAGAIRQRAYQLWDQDGRPEGREIDYWLRAEAELGGADIAGGTRPGEDMTAPSVPDEPGEPPRPARRQRKRPAG